MFVGASCVRRRESGGDINTESGRLSVGEGARDLESGNNLQH